MGKLTIILVDFLSAALAFALPIHHAAKALTATFGAGQVGKNLNPQGPVGEIAVVEGESKVGAGSRPPATGGRKFEVHYRPLIKQFQNLIFLYTEYDYKTLKKVVQIRNENEEENPKRVLGFPEMRWLAFGFQRSVRKWLYFCAVNGDLCVWTNSEYSVFLSHFNSHIKFYWFTE